MNITYICATTTNHKFIAIAMTKQKRFKMLICKYNFIKFPGVLSRAFKSGLRTMR